MTEKKNEENITQLQMYEQSLQNILMQKQQFQAQMTEMDSALKELETAKESYRIIGNIMVSTDKETLKKDLETKNSSLKIRIETLEKQEENIKNKAQELQSEIMKGMEDKK